MARVQLFLSAVSAEFSGYRERLDAALDRNDVEIKEQRSFIVTGGVTLEMLDTYIQSCDGVIHLVGDMTGAMAMAPSVAAIAQKYPELASRFPLAEFLQPDGPSLSYTQWEAWLALLHRKPLFIATPKDGTPRDENYVRESSQQALQQAHLARLNSVERFAGCSFASQDDLAVQVLRSFVLDLLVQAGLTRRPLTLPFKSIGPLFKGRAALIEQLEVANRPVALMGPGGVGKTRLAIEHAWKQVGRCNAVLLISASSAEALNRNLAGLCGGNALDLPQQSATEEASQRQAVLHWLQANPGWLLILDNVDTTEAAAEIESLLPQLGGGQVVLTTRLRNWSAAVKGLEVDVLEPDDARDFLLERTAERRRKADDDVTTAQAIAMEDLGGLALALEQAGAYISQRRLSLAAYRSQWQSQRQVVLAWSDAQLMQYNRSLATTWLTSYQEVDPPARTLLRRLAWFSSEPIPESLLEVEVPGDPEAAAGAWEAISQLEAYSLVNRSGEAPTVSLHRLVQEVGRLWQQQREQPEANELQAALGWLNGAFVGHPQDVRNWEVLDPLASHAKAVAWFAEASGISEPTARVMSQLGVLLHSKAAYAEAEPLYKCALANAEARYGTNHPRVATDLNNLAELLRATNRFVEAEPLYLRALEIDEATYGPSHPRVATHLNNLAVLLWDTGRLSEAEQLIEKALMIDEAEYGPNHHDVIIDLNNLARLKHATGSLLEAEQLMRRVVMVLEANHHHAVATALNNLAQLLSDTGRSAEAEPLMRRALAIHEAAYGPDHPNVATLLNNLAVLMHTSERLAEAEPLMKRALAIDEAKLDPQHPDIARDLYNLARLLQDTGRVAEAEELMRQNVEILLASIKQGYQHPKLEAGVGNYITLLQEKGLPDPEIQAKLQALQPPT